MKTEFLAKNVSYHIHPTSKFKDVTISVRFLNQLKNTNHVARLYLANMLRDVCTLYPTKTDVTRKLDELYGASLKVNNDTLGIGDLIEFRCSVVNGTYIHDDCLQKQIALLNNFIFHPLTKDGMLKKNLYEEIKERLILMIRSHNDTPSSYAANQSRLLFGNDLALKCIPTEEDVINCSLQEIQKAYQQMINEDIVDILVLGDVNESELKKLINENFNFKDRDDIDKNVAITSQRESYDEIIEKRPIHQTRLVQIYTTNHHLNDDSYAAIMLGNAIWGGLPSSYLFQEVREARSLCYSIHSSNDNYDGTITVSTAIDKNNYDEVKDLIELQLNHVKNGDFDDKLLETTKQMLINILRSGQDSQKSILGQDYRNTLFNTQRTAESIIKDIQKCTLNDIKEAFSTVSCKLCYCLTQEDSND